MAIQRSNSLSGRVGPVVHYQLNGKGIVRIRPQRMRHTAATKLASKQFGIASKMSARLKAGFWRSLDGLEQPNMRYRFARVVQDWLKYHHDAAAIQQPGFSPLERFQFNEKCSLSDKFNSFPSVNWHSDPPTTEIPDIVPVRDIIAPPQTLSIKLTIEFECCSLEGNLSPGERIDLELPYDDKLVEGFKKEWPFPLQKSALALGLVSLKYRTKQTDSDFLKDERWLPVAVVASFFNE